MEFMILMVQGCAGAALTLYGSYSLIRYRKKRMNLTGKFVLSFVCMLAGIVLLGYVFGRVV